MHMEYYSQLYTYYIAQFIDGENFDTFYTLGYLFLSSKGDYSCEKIQQTFMRF